MPSGQNEEFSTINVKVGKLPGKIEEYALNGNRTVADALEVAELSAEGFEIRVNAEKSEEDRELEDGDTVLLAKKIKGNS